MTYHEFKNSSMLKCCEHDQDCLTITFHNGAKYRYEGVPTHEFHALIGSDSAGSHFGKNIKGKYKHKRIDE